LPLSVLGSGTCQSAWRQDLGKRSNGEGSLACRERLRQKSGHQKSCPARPVGPAPACAAMPEGNWTRSNSYWATSLFRRPRSILAVSNAFKTPLTTGSASSPTAEHAEDGDFASIWSRFLFADRPPGSRLLVSVRPATFRVNPETVSIWPSISRAK